MKHRPYRGPWIGKIGRQEMTEIDAIGLLCPLPVLRARKALIALRPGDLLRLLADDPVAIVDVPHFCAQGGHSLLSVQDLPQGQAYVIRRGDQGTV